MNCVPPLSMSRLTPFSFTKGVYLVFVNFRCKFSLPQYFRYKHSSIFQSCLFPLFMCYRKQFHVPLHFIVIFMVDVLNLYFSCYRSFLSPSLPLYLCVRENVRVPSWPRSPTSHRHSWGVTFVFSWVVTSVSGTRYLGSTTRPCLSSPRLVPLGILLGGFHEKKDQVFRNLDSLRPPTSPS